MLLPFATPAQTGKERRGAVPSSIWRMLRNLPQPLSDRSLRHAPHSVGSELLDRLLFQLDRSCPAENRNRTLQARAHLVHFLDEAVERGERTVRHPHLLAD